MTGDEPMKLLMDKQAIGEVLARYCHGVDRCDLETLKSAYWEDAIDDHGTFNGPAMEFCEHLIPALKSMRCTMHQISNVWIQVEGEAAKVETYCVAYHLIPSEDGLTEMVVGGRYLDRMEKRSGEWRIAHRLYVMDWNRSGPSSAEWDEGLMGQLKTRGDRFPNDPYDRL